MHVSLTDRLEAWVREKVDSGLYNNSSEVIREALRAKMRAEMSEAERLEALKAEIQIGLDQLDRGETETLTLDQLKSELRAAHRREDDAA